MTGTRRTGDDRSNMNKIYKPIAGYVSNVIKEGGQAVKAWSNALDASDKAKYGTRPGAPKEAAKRAATVASKKQDAAQGQFLGALLQGRRYDDKTGKQIIKKAKGK
jgi:hypothetical protein